MILNFLVFILKSKIFKLNYLNILLNSIYVEFCYYNMELIFKMYWNIEPLFFHTTCFSLIDIYRTFHPKTMNFTFFSSAHGTFSRIDVGKTQILVKIFFI